jgi:predicted ATP-grasp superfamily ATP-dependent carboligase
MDLARKLGTKPILIPNGDHFSLLADRYADLLATAYLFPRPQPGAVARLYRKCDLYELCRETGVPTAKTFFPASLEEALGAAAHMTFPVVLKAIDPDRLARHARVRMRVIHVPSDLSGAYRALEEPGFPNLALQEFIPTDAEGSGVISAYFDGHGVCRFAITARKLRQLPIDGGVTTLAVSAPCDAMVESLSRIVTAAGYRGIVDADFCRDTRDGQWKLLDVNPRMGANFRALVDRNGLDVARALYLDLTGQDIPPVEPEWGRRWLNEKMDWGALRSHLRVGSLTYREWFRSVRSVSELAYWSWSDPGPSVRFASRVAGRRLRGLVGRLRLG